MTKLAIIADDLSSATDCGIQVASRGPRTHVPLSWGGIASAAESADVVAVDTDSRTVPAEEAYARVRRATGLVVAAGFHNIYKSLDSTLRGNLGAEVDAVLDVLHVDLAAIAPAFPLYGRTTLNGKHFLNGLPINTTEFATDPQCPVGESDLVRLFSSQSNRKAGLLPLAVLHDGNRAVARHLATLIAQKVEMVIFDVQVEADLDRIARSVGASEYRILWVGSTGLARCIPGVLGMPARHDLRPERRSATDLALLVVGSASEVTQQQLRNLMKERDVLAVEMNPLRIIAAAREATLEMERCCLRLVEALLERKDAVLCVPSSRKTVAMTQSLGCQTGLSPLEVSARIVAALGHTARLVVDACKLRGLILTGGDTAKAVCGQLGAVGIHIWDEVEPGIALGQLIGGHELLVVVKAGGFGSPDALIKSVEALKVQI